MTELKIDPELQALLPELTTEEKWQLELNLMDNGCLSPLIAWDDLLLDGHNRYELCKKHGIVFEVKRLDFSCRDDAMRWMLTNQLSRRNLTPFQKAEIALKFKPVVEAQAKKNQGTRTDLSQNLEKSSEDASVDTMKELGRLANMSHENLRKVERILQKGDLESLKNLRAGRTSIHKEHERLRKEEDRQNEVRNYSVPKGTEWMGTPSNTLDEFAKRKPQALASCLSYFFSKEFVSELIVKLTLESTNHNPTKKIVQTIEKVYKQLFSKMDATTKRKAFKEFLAMMQKEDGEETQKLIQSCLRKSERQETCVDK